MFEFLNHALEVPMQVTIRRQRVIHFSELQVDISFPEFKYYSVIQD